MRTPEGSSAVIDSPPTDTSSSLPSDDNDDDYEDDDDDWQTGVTNDKVSQTTDDKTWQGTNNDKMWQITNKAGERGEIVIRIEGTKKGTSSAWFEIPRPLLNLYIKLPPNAPILVLFMWFLDTFQKYTIYLAFLCIVSADKWRLKQFWLWGPNIVLNILHLGLILPTSGSL